MERKNKILYLGLDPSHCQAEGDLVHHPVIRIIPYEIPKEIPSEITHILLTSKTATSLLLSHVNHFENKKFISIGKITAQEMRKYGIEPIKIAEKETQEGIIDILETMDLSSKHILFPHSSKSRDLISNYFRNKKLNFREWILYETVVNHLTLVNLDHFDEIIFTSSSTVDAFFFLYGKIPLNKIIHAIGPITKKRIDKYTSIR